MPRASGEPSPPSLAVLRLREPLAGRLEGPREVLLRVRGGDEAGLVLARGEVDAAGDHVPEKVLERLRVRSSGGGEIRDRLPGEEEAHHRAELVYGERDVACGGGLVHAAPPALAELLETLVEAWLAARPEGSEAGGHREWVAGEGARLVDRAGGGDEVHDLPPPTIRPARESAAHNLPQGREVRRHAEALLGATPRQPEAGHDLVEDQERA